MTSKGFSNISSTVLFQNRFYCLNTAYVLLTGWDKGVEGGIRREMTLSTSTPIEPPQNKGKPYNH
jgi:hypothetical protein